MKIELLSKKKERMERRTLIIHELMVCSKCVSQKRNWSNNNYQWYNILVTYNSNSTYINMRLKYLYSVISVNVELFI